MEDFAIATLDELNPTYVPLPEFRQATSGGAGGEVLMTPLSLGGSANARIIPSEPCGSPAAEEFRQRYYRFNSHLSPAQNLILLDRPCYLVVGAGVVILEDRRILLDTVYPSTGEKTIERMIGGGVTAENLAEEINSAPQMPEGPWAPLLSRWSNVYYHAVSESLVHDDALARAGLSSLVTFVAPEERRGAQDMAVRRASSNVELVSAAVVKVPRVVVSSLLYRHSVMGVDFLNFIERAKARALMGKLPLPSGRGARVYLSRLGAAARPMGNEQELAEALANLGFRIVKGEGLSFDDQIRALSDASFVVGPHGAGLVNAAFAKPGSTLYELRPLNRRGESPMWGMTYLKLSSVMGFAYCAHVSENEPDREEWSANLDEILPRIRTLLG